MRGRRLVLTLGTALLAAQFASAYSYFWRYPSRFGAVTPVPQKFDVAALPDKTLPFFVSDNGPALLAANDSFAAVLSQIRAAARVWNDVETSDLRLSYGGQVTPGTPQSGPHVEVIFDEVPPGVAAQGGPITVVDNGQAAFTPIVKSLLIFNRDLRNRASFTESFFNTAVHEFGHTLGLQHTWTSGAMTTATTRATSKARPLSADDVAGISTLYPTKNFSQTFGSITGRVTMGGAGVHLAEVVALGLSGQVVGALTLPDGSYTMDGVPPGAYYVYAHPLPPGAASEPQPVNLELPYDPAGKIAPGPAFDLAFYPGGNAPTLTVSVSAGTASAGVDLGVNRRERVSAYGVQTYSFYGSEAIKPAQLSMASGRGTIYAIGTGIAATAAGALPGLSIQPVAGPDTYGGGLSAYAIGTGYLAFDMMLQPFAGEGPRHLMFTVAGESYIQPAAYVAVQKPAPMIQAIIVNADRTVSLTGANFSAQSRVWFDGAPAAVRAAGETQLTVTPPPAPPGYRAVVTVLNPDGQSSVYMHGAKSPVYAYDAPADTPQFYLSLNSLPAGAESVIELTGTGVDFNAGPPKLAFGTTDISVRKAYVLSSNRAQFHIVIAPGAAPALANATVSSGLQSAVLPAAFTVAAANPRQSYVALSAAGLGAINPGAIVTLPVANLPVSAALANTTVQLGDRTLLLGGVGGGTVTFFVPANMPAGPAILRIHSAGEPALPIVLNIELPPLVITGATSSTGVTLDSTHAARPGETINLHVTGLTDGQAQQPWLIRAIANGAELAVGGVTPSGVQQGLYVVQVTLPSTAAPGTTLPVSLQVEGRVSAAIQVTVR